MIIALISDGSVFHVDVGMNQILVLRCPISMPKLFALMFVTVSILRPASARSGSILGRLLWDPSPLLHQMLTFVKMRISRHPELSEASNHMHRIPVNVSFKPKNVYKLS